MLKGGDFVYYLGLLCTCMRSILFLQSGICRLLPSDQCVILWAFDSFYPRSVVLFFYSISGPLILIPGFYPKSDVLFCFYFV